MMPNKRQRMKNRATAKALHRMFHRCPNCGEAGPHFVPPSLGDPGFYICKPKDHA